MASPSIRATEILRNKYLTVSRDHAQRILILTRSALAFENVEEIEATIAALAAAVPDAQRAGFSVLNDYRLGPVRVHPALEPAFARFRAETERGFTRAALVVATTVGRMRSDRLRGRSTVPFMVYEALDEALTFLTQR